MKHHLSRPQMLRIVLALIAPMVSLGVAASGQERVRLVVGIMVDGLDNDCLEVLQDHFGEGGIRRLREKGAVILNADYGTFLDPAAAAALTMSGAEPAVSGIPSAEVYDREKMRAVKIFSDPSFIGNSTNSTYSPKALRVSNLADELRIAAGGVNIVYSIAPDAATAIAMAGHAANGALWLDEKTGNWASSTYYKDFPTSVATRNRISPLTSRMDTMSWTPSLKGDEYPGLPDHLTHYPFRYVFPRGSADRFNMFLSSPMANNEVTAVAMDLLGSLSLGTHDGADMLTLSYSLTPYPYTKNADTRVEMMDSYIKLDRCLEQLFNTVDKKIGLKNSVIFLAATPPRTTSRRDDEKWGIPHGEFSTRKAISLLNMYLMAKFGNGEYVNAYHNGQFFLNHRLIKDRNLDLREIRSEAAAFLVRMTGVTVARSLDDVISGTATHDRPGLHRNTSIEHAGDVSVEVAPGFEIIDDYNTVPPSNRTPMAERHAATTAVMMIMAPSVEPTVIDTPVDARVLAPTVARILRIRSPNAASAAPLHL